MSVMSIDFSNYANCIDIQDEECREALGISYQEAARNMSPAGLQSYLDGMRALCSMGRSQDLVLTYIQVTPMIAQEFGEDVVADIIFYCMKLASHTSGTVITLLLTSLPLAAQRLGDAELFRGYLSLMHQLASRAPRSLRPMLVNMDELLSKLTLGGLRRWALWGAEAHQRDFEGQMAYFGLKSSSSRSILKKERRGTLFVDNQRKLNFYLRALWGRAFSMRPTSGDYESRQGLRPYIENFQLHLPDAYGSYPGVNGVECYRAAAAHMAAHLVYTTGPFSAQKISPAQMRCIELFEDARVEALAIQQFPGLQRLWKKFIKLPVNAVNTIASEHACIEFMLRISRLLLDENLTDQDAVLNRLAEDFRNKLRQSPQDNQISWMSGMAFYDYLVERNELPTQRVLDNLPIMYRDDNRYSWCFDSSELADFMSGEFATDKQQVRKYVTPVEMANELDCELAGDDAEEIWMLETPFYLDQESCTINQLEGKEPVSQPYHYPEWDYRAQLYRPDWSKVVERRQPRGNAEDMDVIMEKYKPLANRLRHVIDALQPQGIVRRRGYDEGEELDLNAAVRAMTDIRRGVMPDTRVNIRITRHIRDLAVVLLLDLSESTNDPVDKTQPDGPTILDLTREASGLLAWAIDSIGDPFAIHGFASDGRQDVQYARFMDFDQSYDVQVKSCLAGMRGGLSTRMGTALRHCGWHLQRQECRRKLVLLVTDGEPADIDECDPQYLCQDAKKAVENLASIGIDTYCLTLDADADRYVSRIFGENNYSILDNIERLPERLPAVFTALTR